MNADAFAEVLREAADAYAVTPEEVLGRSRSKSVVAARRLAMRACRTRWGWSYPEIGKAFGRDHSTVMSAIKADVSDVPLLRTAPKPRKLRVA